MIERPASAVAALLTGAVTTSAVVVLALRDPHVPGSYLGCPLFVLTGLVCAGCGGLRAVHDLTTGDLAGAWAMNPVLVVVLPALVLAWCSWLLRAWTGRGVLDRVGRGRAVPGARWAPWWLLGTLVVVSVARNVPALAPLLGPVAG